MDWRGFVRHVRARVRERLAPTDDADQSPATISRDLEIVRFVQDQGGRTTQPVLVDNLDVSEATVSRDLSDLESEGVIVRYSVGRIKVVEIDEENAVDALASRTP